MFCIYGLVLDLEDEISRDLIPCEDFRCEIKVRRSDLSFLRDKNEIKWYHHWNKLGDKNWWLSAGHCKDGSYHLRLENAVDFLISPKGDLIQYHIFEDFKDRNVGKALFNQIIPMVLNLRGIETLHASCVLSTKGAIAFVGNGGYGKSTLAAGLLHMGLKLLSDDAVPLRLESERLWTSSGVPRMGLWPRSRDLLGVNVEIDIPSDKAYVKMSPVQFKSGDFPLTHIYFLNPSDKETGVKIISMETQETFIELTRAAHRLDLTDNKMLRRQFIVLHQVSKQTIAKKLIYHADIPDIKELCQAVLFDLESSTSSEITLSDLQEISKSVCMSI
jgi:hypothetical protein